RRPSNTDTRGIFMSTYDELLNKIEARTSRIGIIGLGYVGLPLAARAGQVGFPVVGFDIGAERVARINRGESYIGDVTSEEIADLREHGRLEATGDFRRLGACDIVIICVPTPLNVTRDPDISSIVRAAEDIARMLHRGQLVVLESTSYQGTTEEVLRPRLEATGLQAGED